MATLKITVLKNELVLDFAVTVRDGLGNTPSFAQAQFQKQSPGTYAYGPIPFVAGETLPALFAIFGGGAGAGHPLAWAELNYDGSDLEPQLAAEILPGTNKGTASYTYPISPAALQAFHPGNQAN